MRSTKATRWLSGTLAALLLAQGMCLPAGAWSWGGWGNWGSSRQTSQVETLGETQTVQLQNGTAIIPADADEAAVKQVLFDALVIIAIFKIKAYSRMNGTNLHSPVELQPEMHAESHLEEHPMSLL